jgi:hypothetical protein
MDALNIASEAERIESLLVGAVDLHCHSGPSVMPRDLDHIEALQQASAAGLRAVLFKDHYYSVTPTVRLLEKYYGELGVTMLSGVPLNNTSGGLNKYAVEHGVTLGANIVWMPTFSAANHIRHDHRHRSLPTTKEMLKPQMLSIVDDMGRLKDEVKVILDQIAEADIVLSAGHSHISEIWPLFEEAKARGVNRRLVQHPTFVVGANLKDIAELAADGAWIEHSICMFDPASRFNFYDTETLRGLIKAGTIEKTILGSDLGQIDNPMPVDGFRAVIKQCIDLGHTDDEIRAMVGGNAVALVGEHVISGRAQ